MKAISSLYCLFVQVVTLSQKPISRLALMSHWLGLGDVHRFKPITGKGNRIAD